MKAPPEKQTSEVMDWITHNFIDFTTHKLGLTIDASWGFVGMLCIILFFILFSKVKGRKRRGSE